MNQNWQHIAIAFEKIFGVLNQQIQLQAQADELLNRCPCIRKHAGPSRSFDPDNEINSGLIYHEQQNRVVPQIRITGPQSASDQSGNVETFGITPSSSINPNENTNQTKMDRLAVPKLRFTRRQSDSDQSGNVESLDESFVSNPYVSVPAPPSSSLNSNNSTNPTAIDRLTAPQMRITRRQAQSGNVESLDYETFVNNPYITVRTPPNNRTNSPVSNRLIVPQITNTQPDSENAQSVNVESIDHSNLHVMVPTRPRRITERLTRPDRSMTNGAIVPQFQVTEPAISPSVPMPDLLSMAIFDQNIDSIESQLENETMPNIASMSHSSLITHTVEVLEEYELIPDDDVSRFSCLKFI